jgi:hypothetical protein
MINLILILKFKVGLQCEENLKKKSFKEPGMEIHLFIHESAM